MRSWGLVCYAVAMVLVAVCCGGLFACRVELRDCFKVGRPVLPVRRRGNRCRWLLRLLLAVAAGWPQAAALEVEAVVRMHRWLEHRFPHLAVELLQTAAAEHFVNGSEVGELRRRFHACLRDGARWPAEPSALSRRRVRWADQCGGELVQLQLVPPVAAEPSDALAEEAEWNPFVPPGLLVAQAAEGHGLLDVVSELPCGSDVGRSHQLRAEAPEFVPAALTVSQGHGAGPAAASAGVGCTLGEH